MTTVKVVNRWGKTRPASDPYVTLKDGDWTYMVLKAYQAPEKERDNRYARAMVLVVTPYTGSGGDMGDTYIKEIPGYREARDRWERDNREVV